jgi:succinoglycan biosynthesis protein ExoA
MQKPFVIVIIPVYNEVHYIDEMVASVIGQQHDSFNLELLIVDGGSTDGTTAKIETLAQNNTLIRVIHNSKKISPAAFNLGIQHAKGNYIAILGAHSKYDKDYLAICLEEAITHHCAGCSGKIVVAKNDADIQSVLIYYMLTSSFGVSSKSYRTAKEGISEQCPYPVFEKSIFNEVGWYNEQLVRNQDNDMNYRIMQAGHKLYYTHKVSAYYYPKQTIKGLFDYAKLTGKWNAVSLQLNPGSMGLRHVVPFIFCSGLLGLLLGTLATAFLMPQIMVYFLWPLLFIIGLHLSCGLVVAISAFANTKKAILFVLPFLFFSFHFLYGYGTLHKLVTGK